MQSFTSQKQVKGIEEEGISLISVITELISVIFLKNMKHSLKDSGTEDCYLIGRDLYT